MCWPHIRSELWKFAANPGSERGTEHRKVGVLLLEVASVYRDIRAAQRQRAVGEISRDDFIRITVKRSCMGVGSAAGTAVALALPLPLAWVGIPLSSLIGQGVGAIGGRYLGEKVVGGGGSIK